MRITQRNKMKLLTLENGLRIIFDKKQDMRSATAGVWVAAGSRYESEKQSGISHFIEHMVFKGSKKRTAFEIAEGMDAIGAQVNAYTTKEYTFFYTKALDYQLLSAVDILFDMIKNPRFDKEDIETEKGVICEEIAMCEDDPSDVCYEAAESSMYRSCSLSGPILGTKKSISAFQKEDFTDYMNRFYVPERTVVGVCGNFDEEKTLAKISQYFESDKNTAFALCETKAVLENGTINLIKKQFEQTHIMLTFDGVGIEHEDLQALQVAMFILGNGSSSRLNQRIREQLGLVYEISSWLGRYLGTGYIAVNMSLAASSQKTALEETCKIIRELAATVTEKELSTAKEKLIASLIMSREQPQSKLSYFGYCCLMLSKFIEDDSIIESIKAVTHGQVKEVCEKYLKLESASVTVVGSAQSEEFYKDILKA